MMVELVKRMTRKLEQWQQDLEKSRNLPEMPNDLTPAQLELWRKRQIVVGLLAFVVGMVLLCVFAYLVML